MTGDTALEVRLDQRIDIEMREAQGSMHGQVALHRDIPIQQQLRLFEVRAPGQVHLRTLGRRSKAEVAGTLVVESQVVNFKIGIPCRGIKCAGALRFEVKTAADGEAPPLQVRKLRHVEPGAGEIEPDILVIKVIGEGAVRLARVSRSLQMVELDLAVGKQKVTLYPADRIVLKLRVGHHHVTAALRRGASARGRHRKRRDSRDRVVVSEQALEFREVCLLNVKPSSERALIRKVALVETRVQVKTNLCVVVNEGNIASSEGVRSEAYTSREGVPVNLPAGRVGGGREQGIEIVERVPIPDDLVPADAHVEIAAKKAAGYYSPEAPKPQDLAGFIGRGLDKY